MRILNRKTRKELLADIESMRDDLAFCNKRYIMAAEKSIFWRRSAYVQRFGTPEQVQRLYSRFDQIGWPEAINVDEVAKRNIELLGLWDQVFESSGCNGAMSGRSQDDNDEYGRDDSIKPLESLKMANPLVGSVEIEGKHRFFAVSSKGVRYFLNSKVVTLRANKPQTIYFFSTDVRDTNLQIFPAGYTINENPRNAMLTVKRTEESK